MSRLMIMAHWLLQTNSKDERAAELLAAAGHHPAAWPIRRYREVIAPGDGVAVWVSGRKGGAVAIGAVAAPPEQDADGGWTVAVALERVFSPIGRDDLRADERFAGAMVLRAPGGGNPLPLEQAEWEAIEERVPPHGPVAATVRGAAAVVVAGATAVREALKTAVRRP